MAVAIAAASGYIGINKDYGDVVQIVPTIYSAEHFPNQAAAAEWMANIGSVKGAGRSFQKSELTTVIVEG